MNQKIEYFLLLTEATNQSIIQTDNLAIRTGWFN